MKIHDFFKEKYDSIDFFYSNRHLEYDITNTHFSVTKAKFNRFLQNFKTPDDFTKDELEKIFEIFLSLEKDKISDNDLENLLYTKQKEDYQNNTKKIIETFVGATTKPRDYEGEVYSYKNIFLIEDEDLKKIKKMYDKLFKCIDYLFINIIINNFSDISDLNFDIIKKNDNASEKSFYEERIVTLKKNYNLLLEDKIERKDLVRADIPVYGQYLLKKLNLSNTNRMFFSKYFIGKSYNESALYDLNKISNLLSINFEDIFNIFFLKREKLKNSKKSLKQLLKKYDFFRSYYCDKRSDYEFPISEICHILFILENIFERKIYKQQCNSKKQILEELSKKYNETKDESLSYLIFYARETNKIQLVKKLSENIDNLIFTLESTNNIQPKYIIGTINSILHQISDMKVLEPIMKLALNFEHKDSFICRKILCLTDFIENN